MISVLERAKTVHALNFLIYVIRLVALGPWVYSASNRNEYQKQRKMCLGIRVRVLRKADSLTATCESIN
jgi:hypothetical protein